MYICGYMAHYPFFLIVDHYVKYVSMTVNNKKSYLGGLALTLDQEHAHEASLNKYSLHDVIHSVCFKIPRFYLTWFILLVVSLLTFLLLI